MVRWFFRSIVVCSAFCLNGVLVAQANAQLGGHLENDCEYALTDVYVQVVCEEDFEPGTLALYAVDDASAICAIYCGNPANVAHCDVPQCIPAPWTRDNHLGNGGSPAPEVPINPLPINPLPQFDPRYYVPEMPFKLNPFDS